MNIVDRVIRSIAKEIQKTTGEHDRRENVARLKATAKEFKERVSLSIEILNDSIRSFNRAIANLNSYRRNYIKNNIDTLMLFLGHFGSCKSPGYYASEQEKNLSKFPEQDYKKIEDYICVVDWSKDDIFLDTFFLSPVGMKIKTRQQNLSLIESINELTIFTQKTINELDSRMFATELETKICERYLANIKFISETIHKKIIPEIDIILSFFQAEKIKDEVLCGHSVQNITFKYNIQSLKNTPYHKHYVFVKNTLAFYVISCKIYNTPVLTKLLNSDVTEEDYQMLKQERKLLNAQYRILKDTSIFSKDGENQ